MFKAILVSATLCASLCADTPTFGEIPWGTSKPSVQAKLALKGYTPDPKYGEAAYIGTLVGVQTQVFVYEAPGKRLAKVIVNLLTKDEYAISTYKTVRDILIKRLGEPSIVKVDFTAPYVNGDGNEQQAIKSEKAKILSVWPYNSEKTCGVMIEITPKLTVQVTYEADAWAEHIKNIRAAEAEVL